jgi:hypothetical protein
MVAPFLTTLSKALGFPDVCCKNVTAGGARRLDMYQLVSTIVLNSMRARAEAPLSDLVAGLRRAVGDLSTCRGNYGI